MTEYADLYERALADPPTNSFGIVLTPTYDDLARALAECDGERLKLRDALETIANGRLRTTPGINPDGSVSSSTMAECLARAALAGRQADDPHVPLPAGTRIGPKRTTARGDE